MAFQRRSGGGRKGATKPVLSVAMSVKQGNGYIKGPNFGLWDNTEGGPIYRGTLKDDRLGEVLEFLSNAFEAQLPVGLAVFENNEGQGGGAFKKPGGFKKSGGFNKKPNPFKKQQQQEEEEGPDEGEQEPEF